MSSWEEPPSEFSTAPSSCRQNKREETAHTFRPIMDERGDSYPANDAARAIPVNAFCRSPHQLSLYPYSGSTYDQYFNNTAAPYPPALPYSGHISYDWNPAASIVESYPTIPQNQDHRLNSSLMHDHLDHTSTAWYTPVLPYAGHDTSCNWNPERNYYFESYPRLFQDQGLQTANQQGFMSPRPAIHPSFDAAKIAAAWEARKSSKSQKQDKASGRRRQPLTAYNIFFSEQRDLILRELEAQEKGLPPPPPPTGPPAILHRDPYTNNKRSHRKVHGKISLQALTQRIGERWKALGARDKQQYLDWAYQDKMRLLEEQERATERQDEKCWALQGEKQELDTNAQEPSETFDANEFPRAIEPSPPIDIEAPDQEKMHIRWHY